MVHLGDPCTLPWDWRGKNVAAPSTPPPPLSLADYGGGWDGDNNPGPNPTTRTTACSSALPTERLAFLFFFLTKGVLFHFLCGRPFYFNKILLKKIASGLSFYLM